MKKEKTITILSVFTVLFTVIGGTLAYWSWDTTEAQKTLVTFSVADNFSCSVDGGGNITSNTYNVAPASCTNSTYAIKREVTTTVEVTGNEPVTMDLVININNLGTGLTNSENFMYALTEAGSSSCSENVISQGSFNGKTTGNTISILNKTYEETTTETYDLWIWLDSVERSSSTQNQPFNLSLGGTCTDTPMDYFYAVYTTMDYSLNFYDREESEIIEYYEQSDTPINAMYRVYENAVYTLQNLPPWHEYAELIENVYVRDTIAPTSTQMWFYHFENSYDFVLNDLDTSNVTSMAYMFYQTGMTSEEFAPVGLTSWNTSKVKDMSYMFVESGYSTWNVGEIGEYWDVSNVMNMASMFEYAAGDTEFAIDISSWNVGKVRDMSRMFYECGGGDFYTGDLDTWVTSNVKNMSSMFEYAGEGGSSFSIGWLNDWDVSNVTNMNSMFSSAGKDATSFNIGELDAWNVSNVTNMGHMFSGAGYEATTFNIGDISSWNTYNVTNMEYMFNNTGRSATNFSLDLSRWDVRNVTNHNNFNSNVTSKITLPLAWQS